MAKRFQVLRRPPPPPRPSDVQDKHISTRASVAPGPSFSCFMSAFFFIPVARPQVNPLGVQVWLLGSGVLLWWDK